MRPPSRPAPPDPGPQEHQSRSNEIPHRAQTPSARTGGNPGRAGRRPDPRVAPPPVELQLRILRKVRGILEEESFTTYPFALVHALADLSVRMDADSGNELRLPLRVIAERVVELYWPQVAPWPGPDDEGVLVQNAGRKGGSRRRAAIVRKVMEARREHGEAIERLRERRKDWNGLLSSVQGTLRGGPVLELQRGHGETRELLYPERIEGRGRTAAITLSPGVAYTLRTSHPRVVGLARAAWTRFVHRTNPGAAARPTDLQPFLFDTSPPGRPVRPDPGGRAVPHPGRSRRSTRWVREFVNGRHREFDAAIEEASGARIRGPIEWLSPLESDDFAAYRGGGLLERLGVSLPERPLETFWPPDGPLWDALGRDADGALVLVDSKSTVPEMLSAPADVAPSTRVGIGAALEEVRDHLGVGTAIDWAATFHHYTSRLAHLHLLHELNGIDAWFVSVYFVGDREARGPADAQEWNAPVRAMHRALGLTPRRLPRRRIEVFLDVGTEDPGL